MVRLSAWWGSKSVDAITISSPFFQSPVFKTSIVLLPAAAVFASLVQESFRLPCRLRVPPMSMIPRSPIVMYVFTRDVIGQGNGRIARVGVGFTANLQLPVQHDPLGGQFKISIVCEAQFAVDRQTAQRRRTDIEDNVHVFANGDCGAFAWHLPVRPGGRIRPALPFDRRRTFC